MPVPTEPTARYRKRRTRTRNINSCPALAVSTLKPHQYDLRPACVSLVCPDCTTWVPITGIRAAVQKLVPHDAGTAKEDVAARCKGSNRRVVIDVAFEVWRARLEAGVAQADGCRSARQHHKPLPPPARPVTKMTPAPLNAADALTAYREHLKKCRASSVAGRCGGTRRCADGARLAALYEQLQRTQAHRDRERLEDARIDALLARYRSATGAQRAAAEWSRQHAATADAEQLAKRSGTALEEANNTCRNRPADTVSEYRGPQLPLWQPDIS